MGHPKNENPKVGIAHSEAIMEGTAKTLIRQLHQQINLSISWNNPQTFTQRFGSLPLRYQSSARTLTGGLSKKIRILQLVCEYEKQRRIGAKNNF